MNPNRARRATTVAGGSATPNSVEDNSELAGTDDISDGSTGTPCTFAFTACKT